jgi:thiosulfate/3-mercaptopyruvate sulfurtransferase
MPRISSLVAVLAIMVFGLLAVAGPALAAQPLVDAAWLKHNGDQPNVVILDVRNKLGKGSEEVYRAGHVPGSIYSDYLKAGWRTKVDGVVGQLPPVADLETLIGGLGIGNDSHVVVVASGVSALDMGSATRVYWTFKVLGHDEVSVVDGGYRAYAADPGNPVETGWNAPVPTTFKASFRPELVADYQAVQAAKAQGQALIDFRPPPQYMGTKAFPAAKRPGTIPGAVNVPESKLTGAGIGRRSAGSPRARSWARRTSSSTTAPWSTGRPGPSCRSRSRRNKAVTMGRP